jgi:hypothetical protein
MNKSPSARGSKYGQVGHDGQLGQLGHDGVIARVSGVLGRLTAVKSFNNLPVSERNLPNLPACGQVASPPLFNHFQQLAQLAQIVARAMHARASSGARGFVQTKGHMMALIPLRDHTVVEWFPTTALRCACCEGPIDIHTLWQPSRECANFLCDATHGFPGDLARGLYFYLHKRCAGFERALRHAGAEPFAWMSYDMPYILGRDRVLNRFYGNPQRFPRTTMPQGAYDHLYQQWLPAIETSKGRRSHHHA